VLVPAAPPGILMSGLPQRPLRPLSDVSPARRRHALGRRHTVVITSRRSNSKALCVDRRGTGRRVVQGRGTGCRAAHLVAHVNPSAGIYHPVGPPSWQIPAQHKERI
jgi:hypothetical protein